MPPRTYTFTLEDTMSGTLNTRIPTDPSKHYDVYTSTTAGDPPVPSESTLTLLDPVGQGRRSRRWGSGSRSGSRGCWRGSGGISPSDFAERRAQRPQCRVAGIRAGEEDHLRALAGERHEGHAVDPQVARRRQAGDADTGRDEREQRLRRRPRCTTRGR